MLLKIVQVGEPVLRRRARDLSREEILSDEIQMLIALMKNTMRDAPGVGLAAPQVGIPYALAVIEDRQETLESIDDEALQARKREAVPFHVIINPTIETIGDETAEFFEGCLSLSGFSGLVKRALHVRVKALDEKAQPVTIEAEGWYARILQHEIDHLQGRVYIDRMDPRTFSTSDNFSRHFGRVPLADLHQFLDGK